MLILKQREVSSMNRTIELISKVGNSFILGGQVCLKKEVLPSSVREKLYGNTSKSLSVAVGQLVEEPGTYAVALGLSREVFNSMYDVQNQKYIPSSLDTDIISDVCGVIDLFNYEEKRWKSFDDTEVLLKGIESYRCSKLLNSKEVVVLAGAVKQKIDFINMLIPALSKHSLVYAIYNPLHKKFGVNNRFQLLHKDLLDILSFIMKLDVQAIVSKTKRVTK